MSSLTISPDCSTAFAELRDDKKFKCIIYKIDSSNRLFTEHTYEDFDWNDLKEYFLGTCTKTAAYAVYDFGESYEHKVAFVSWCPNTAPTRTKMIYGTNRDTVKQSFDGISLDIQATDMGDLDNRQVFEQLDKV